MSNVTTPAPKKEVKKSRKAKAQETFAAVAHMKLLGEIITWNARPDKNTTHTHKSVVDALDNAGLDSKIARELLPRFAFSRACKRLSEEAIIEVTKETDTDIRFQFTKKTMRNDEWVYTKETELTLNKTTGNVSCPKADLQATAQRLLDTAMEERTTSDITKIVQRLFEKEADLFPIRDQGGCYFVPEQHTTFTIKVNNFLTALGGKVSRWPIPAGTQEGNKAVAEAISETIQNVIKEHTQAVSQLTINTRKDTIEHVAEKIESTRVRIEAYASYLEDQREVLLKSLEEARRGLASQVDGIEKTRQSMPAGETRDMIYGHAVTAVLRWMGKDKWDFRDVKRCLAVLKVSVADATIRAQLLAGRQGKRGEPAKLSKEQRMELRGHAGRLDEVAA
jgi:hypothetical protein